MANQNNSLINKLITKAPKSELDFLVSKSSSPISKSIMDVVKNKTPIYNLIDIKKTAYKTLRTFVAFQNMCSLTLPNNKQLFGSPASRISVWNRNTELLNLEYYQGLCSSHGLLSTMSPREANLKFLLEKYSRNLDMISKNDTSRSLMYTGDYFFQDAFQSGSVVNQKLKEIVYGKVKVERFLKGSKFVSTLFQPVLANNPLSRQYLEQKLPTFQSSFDSYIQGVIQVLNTKIMDSLDARKRFGCGLPESVINTCFMTPSSLANSGGYNPFDNTCLNLGKNLFDMVGGVVAVGPLDSRDVDKWNYSLNTFYSTKTMNPKLWELNTYKIPTQEEIDQAIPQLDYVWAMSQHILYQSPNIEKNAVTKNNNSTALDVKYALYSDNNTTRLIETCINAEVEAFNTVCTTFNPYIRTYENPCAYSWMNLDDIKALHGSFLGNDVLPDSTKRKLIDATIYYRYVNQNSYPVGDDVTLEMMSTNDPSSTLLVAPPADLTDGRTTRTADLGGEFANNIFEKNFSILTKSQDNDIRVDAINLVADDNNKFMDVRLPSCFYEKRDNKGTMSQLQTNIDYALGYSSNSNVVLLSRTILNSPNNDDFGVFNGKNAQNQANTVQFNNLLNFNTNFTLDTGDEFAQDVKIGRKNPISPKRLMFDTLYTLLSDSMRKYVKIIRDQGNSKRRWNKIDEYHRPYHTRILQSSLLNLDKHGRVFHTPFISYKNSNYVNLLRGVMYDKSTLDYDKTPKAITGSKDFLTQRPSQGNDLTDPLVDSFSYVNSPNFKPYTENTEFPKPQDIYLTRGDGSISDSGDSVSRSESGFGATISTGSKSAYRKERDLRKVLLTKSVYNQYDRALVTDGMNLDASLPFIANGLKALNLFKANRLTSFYEPATEFNGCYARCFDPYLDKDMTLDTLYFYHKAAVNNGAPFSRLLDNQELPKGVISNLVFKPLVMNPYNCTPIKGLNFQLDKGFNFTKYYETKYQLRKEFYAIRFMSLLGSFLSRYLDDPKNNVTLNDKQGVVIFEDAFSMLATKLLNAFNNCKNKEAYNYFLSIIDSVSNAEYPRGEGLIRLCFFETKPFEILLNSVRDWGGYTFQYVNSKSMNIASCLRNSKGQNEGELFINEPNNPRKIGLLEYIIRVELNINLNPGEIIPNDYKERAYRYVCSLDSAQREELVSRCEADLLATVMVYITQITPGASLNPEVKNYFCGIKGKKKPRGMPFLPFSNPQVLTEYLAKIHVEAGTDLLQKINELDCEGNAFSQQEIESTRQVQDNSRTGNNSKNRIVSPQVTMSTQLSDTKSNMSWGVGLIGLSLISYLGYKAYKHKRGKR